MFFPCYYNKHCFFSLFHKLINHFTLIESLVAINIPNKNVQITVLQKIKSPYNLYLASPTKQTCFSLRMASKPAAPVMTTTPDANFKILSEAKSSDTSFIRVNGKYYFIKQLTPYMLQIFKNCEGCSLL